MTKPSPNEAFVAELVGSVLGDWESLLPPQLVREIHDQVAVAIAEGEAGVEGEAEPAPQSRTVPTGTTPRPPSEG